MEEKLANISLTNKIAALPLPEQPKWLVNGELRDYQMEGINWLIKQHDQGVPSILADEMVCGLVPF